MTRHDACPVQKSPPVSGDEKSRTSKAVFRPEIAWRIAGVLILVSLIVAAYHAVSGFEFLQFDDDIYVTGNFWVQRGLSWSGFQKAFTETVAGNWHPVTMLSHMLDCTLFGLAPGPHHWVNVALHAVNSLLLVRLLQRTTGELYFALLVGILFAVHPLRIESVAWISERKDVLSTMFWLLGMGFYVSWVRSRSLLIYGLVMFCLLLGLLSKAMLVTFPFTLLLLDVWPLQRISLSERSPDRKFLVGVRTLVIEKLPLFVITAVFCWVALYAQRSAGAITEMDALSLGVRLQTAVVAYAGYLGKFFYPVGLAAAYPHPRSWAVWTVVGASALILVITAAVVCIGRKRPWWVFGWFWFLGTMIPVVGFVQIGDQWMADRYTYVPFIGPVVALTWELCLLINASWIRRILGTAGFVSVAGCLVWMTSRQLLTWRDTETLSLHAIRTTGGNTAMHTNYAISLAKKGDFNNALKEFQHVVKARPSDPEAVNNVARVLEQMGRKEEAGGYYLTAIGLDPDYAMARQNLGRIYAANGRDDLAVPQFEALMRLRPEEPLGYMQLARIHAITQVPGLRNGKRAVELARRGCDLEPNPSISSREFLAAAYAADGKVRDSIAALGEAVEIARKQEQPDQERRLKGMIEQLRRSIK